MVTTDKSEEGLHDTINELIKAGTSFDIEALNRIYHEKLKVIMIAPNGEKNISDKEMFKKLFKLKKEQKASPLNTWSNFKHTEVIENNGLVILDRKVNLTGSEQLLNLVIYLIWNEGRWQVTREVIFLNQL